VNGAQIFGCACISLAVGIWVACVVAAEIKRAADRIIAHVETQGGLVRLKIQRTEEAIVSAISDKIAEVGAEVSALEASDAASAQSVSDAFARLEALIAAGGASQADLDALDALKVRVDALKAAEDAQKGQADSEHPA